MRMYMVVILLSLFVPLMAHAGEADVVAVEVVKLEDGTFTFDVTVSHNDEGWKHYVNKWDVVGEGGTVFGTRTLYHPHVEEQPFARSLSGIKIPDGITKVTIRAHDSIHFYGGKVVTTVLPR